MRLTGLAAAALATLTLTTPAFGQGGPVATSCTNDISRLCAGKPHDGSVRICLETNYAKVSSACKNALDTTGGGRGKQLFTGKSK